MNQVLSINQERSASSRQSRVLTALSALLLASGTPAFAADVPDFMKIVSVNEGTPAAKDQVAFNDIYALNDGMFPIYEKSIGIYRQNFRERQNLIMALFSAKGGRFILYRAGQPPLEAESPPAVYSMAKAVGHCAMATYDLVAPYCQDAAADRSWVGEMRAYRTRVQTALDSLPSADLKVEDRALLTVTLKQVQAFMDKCLQTGSFTYDDVQSYARGVKPDLAKLITLASSTQVGHWYKVLEQWKQLLGKDWDKTYALSNSIYVARQNNILFSVLVQFMGEKAINDRLLLMETTDFTATPESMMDGFIRIISDRALGNVFYKNYHLMDFELLGGGGRKAIEAEAAKRGLKAVLPPLVPFNSHEWPWKIDPTSGTGPASMDDIQ
jgi:hypothetical protein